MHHSNYFLSFGEQQVALCILGFALSLSAHPVLFLPCVLGSALAYFVRLGSSLLSVFIISNGVYFVKSFFYFFFFFLFCVPLLTVFIVSHRALFVKRF